MYSIGDFQALISEEQNWRKQIYEKRIAYVGGGRASGFGDLRADNFFWPWNPGGTAYLGQPLKGLLFE